MKLALISWIQTYLILTNNDEVCIKSLSSIFLAVWAGTELYFWKQNESLQKKCSIKKTEELIYNDFVHDQDIAHHMCHHCVCSTHSLHCVCTLYIAVVVMPVRQK